MTLLRSARFPAVLLLIAAALGLVAANTPIAGAVFAVQHAHLGIPGTPYYLDVGEWIADGLLAVFFFAVAVELQFELTAGELRSARRAVQPAIAALGGVVAPVVIYLAVAAPSGLARGWPIPTATDIAFALGVLAVFGRGLPSSVRVFLLALAILDDIVGIVLIAVLFAHGVNLGLLALAILATIAFAVLSRMREGARSGWRVAVLIVLALVTWALVLASGVHATIAGVLLGLAIAQQPGVRARHALEPWVNGAILPLFAFSAALVTIPAVGAGLSPVFWGILLALPVGKLLGIAAAGWLGQRLLPSREHPPLALGDLIAAGALGGVGFTVSLLLAGLAFADRAGLRDQAVLGVLAGSLVALVVAAFVVSWRARHHRRTVGATEGEG